MAVTITADSGAFICALAAADDEVILPLTGEYGVYWGDAGAGTAWHRSSASEVEVHVTLLASEARKRSIAALTAENWFAHPSTRVADVERDEIAALRFKAAADDQQVIVRASGEAEPVAMGA